MSNYNTVLSGEHWFKVKDAEKFQSLCQNILSRIGGYDVVIAEGSAAIYGEGDNFSLAGALEDPESFIEDDGSNPILELRNLIEEYVLEPWIAEEVGWENCRYVTYNKYEIKPVKQIFVIVLVENGLVASTWVVEGTADQSIVAAKELATRLSINIEYHDLAVERPFIVQSSGEAKRNSHRIWTWCPEN